MSKRNIIILHIFTWLFAAFLNLGSFSLLANPEMLTVYLVSTFFLLISFYVFYLWIVPRFLETKRYFRFLLVSLLALISLPFVGYSILLFVKAIYRQSFSNFYSVYSLRMHLSGMTVVSIAATFGSFFKVLVNWLNAVNQKEILEKQKAISELSLLKSKVNPHFLFNTLNNIDALIYDDPDKASQSLLKLSEIMRYMSYETVSEHVSLSKEIRYIENIVELYRLRVSNPDCIRLSVPQSYPDLNIAPMLFIPFIENAFKYATFKGEKAGFACLFEIEGREVKFVVFNYFDAKEKAIEQKKGKTGIANVRQRLELMYKDRYWLNISSVDGLFTVNLRIDTHGD